MTGREEEEEEEERAALHLLPDGKTQTLTAPWAPRRRPLVLLVRGKLQVKYIVGK
jgi:hypothetical protein